MLRGLRTAIIEDSSILSAYLVVYSFFPAAISKLRTHAHFTLQPDPVNPG